jgi:hypothetical protein
MGHTLATAEVAIKNRVPFRMRDTLSGIEGWDRDDYGELPVNYWQSLQEAVYVVLSYDTPIGWTMPDGTPIVPDVGYSLTTSQHQYLVLNAWGMRDHPFVRRGRETRPAGGGPRRGGIDDL